MHTVDEDFEHFLSYSGMRNETQEIRQKMYLAFKAAWQPPEMTVETSRQIAARIWCDTEYSHVAMNVELAHQIAEMLRYEANKQAAQPADAADVPHASKSGNVGADNKNPNQAHG